MNNAINKNIASTCWTTGLTGKLTWTHIGAMGQAAKAKHQAANKRELSVAVDAAFDRSFNLGA